MIASRLVGGRGVGGSSRGGRLPWMTAGRARGSDADAERLLLLLHLVEDERLLLLLLLLQVLRPHMDHCLLKVRR